MRASTAIIHLIVIIAIAGILGYFLTGYYDDRIQELDGAIREQAGQVEAARRAAEEANRDAESARLEQERIQAQAAIEQERLTGEIARLQTRSTTLTTRLRDLQKEAAEAPVIVAEQKPDELAASIGSLITTAYPDAPAPVFVLTGETYQANDAAARAIALSLRETLGQRLQIEALAENIEVKDEQLAAGRDLVVLCEAVKVSLTQAAESTREALAHEKTYSALLIRKSELQDQQIQALKRSRFWDKWKTPAYIGAGVAVGLWLGARVK